MSEPGKDKGSVCPAATAAVAPVGTCICVGICAWGCSCGTRIHSGPDPSDPVKPDLKPDPAAAWEGTALSLLPASASVCPSACPCSCSCPSCSPCSSPCSCSCPCSSATAKRCPCSEPLPPSRLTAEAAAAAGAGTGVGVGAGTSVRRSCVSPPSMTPARPSSIAGVKAAAGAHKWFCDDVSTSHREKGMRCTCACAPAAGPPATAALPPEDAPLPAALAGALAPPKTAAVKKSVTPTPCPAPSSASAAETPAEPDAAAAAPTAPAADVGTGAGTAPTRTRNTK